MNDLYTGFDPRPGREDALVPAKLADVIAYLRNLDGVEEVILDWIPASTPDGRYVEFERGPYLVVRLGDSDE